MSDNEPREVDADELAQEQVDEADARERIVAAALERFYGGHGEGEEL